MLQKSKKKSHNQSDKFRDAARELGCDESPAAFDAKLKKLAKHQSEETKKEKGK